MDAPDAIPFMHEATSRIEDFAPLVQRLTQWAIEAGVPQRTLGSAMLILDELFTNSVMHGYDGDPQGRIEVRAWIRRDEVPADAAGDPQAGRRLVVTLTDWAPAFNPLEVPEPDLNASIEDRPIGGLGLLFVRRTADSLAYRLRDAQTQQPANVVTFTKRCAPAGD